MKTNIKDIQKNFELYKVKINDDDTIILKFDPQWWDASAVSRMYRIIADIFPNNKIVSLIGTEIIIGEKESDK